MINEIHLKNFKCFKEINLSTAKLNVLTGLNGMGKSTIIQSLLLIKQSQEQNFLKNKIIINGKYTALGKCKDILYENADAEEIVFGYEENRLSQTIITNYNADADLMDIKSIEGADNLPWLDAGFEYINAERTVPQSVYEQSSLYVDVYNQIGTLGQYTMHYLNTHQDDLLDLPNGEKLPFREVLQLWLNEISPNIKVKIHNIDNTNLTQLNYYYIDAEKSNDYRPVNVGFGITYVLPIIVALLKATPNSTLIIENPEAHLHPRGQRRLGELIAETANRGVQIFLETHSDHILNGIRIAVKKKMIKSEDVNLLFFLLKDEMHTFYSPKIMSNGKIDHWPDGFFDEWDKALDEII